MGDYQFLVTEWNRAQDHGPCLTYWVCGLPIALVCCSVILRLGGMRGKTKLGSAEADVMSYELIIGSFLVYLTTRGFLLFFGLQGDVLQLMAKGPQGRSLPVEEHILVPMFVYQVYNLLICLYLKEFSDVPNLVHHSLVIFIAFLGLGPIWQYYSVYFCGCTELSTIFLTGVDIFAKFPRFRDVCGGVLNKWCRLLFAFTFIGSRLLYWPYLAYFFWIDSLTLLGYVSSSSPLFATPHNKYVLYYYLIGNVTLTGLQFFWGFRIFGFVLNTLKPPQTATKKVQ